MEACAQTLSDAVRDEFCRLTRISSYHMRRQAVREGNRHACEVRRLALIAVTRSVRNVAKAMTDTWSKRPAERMACTARAYFSSRGTPSNLGGNLFRVYFIGPSSTRKTRSGHHCGLVLAGFFLTHFASDVPSKAFRERVFQRRKAGVWI